VLANVLTLTGVAYIFHADNANIVAKAMNSDDRVITRKICRHGCPRHPLYVSIPAALFA